MTKTILFDFDGTLLFMDLNKYLKEYFIALAKFFNSLNIDGNLIASASSKAIIDAMKDERIITIEEKFWEYFKSYCSYDRAIEKHFVKFYQTDFNTIASTTTINEDAIKVIKYLKKQGYEIILATNPVYPLIATKMRIKWAGLDFDDFTYITSYENSHYCKPSIKYYQELITKLDIDPSSTWMIGNDAYEDIVSSEVGFKTYLVDDCLIAHPEYQSSPLKRSSFSELLPFLMKEEKDGTQK